MNQQTVLHERPDKLITKEILTPGDYSVVPYEDARCKILITEISCTNDAGSCEIEPQSRFFSKNFDGIVLIGDSDCFIDRDVELVLERMCCGEKCAAKFVYRDDRGGLVKEICCKIELQEVMEEQLISDWGWQRLHEASLHHKACGVDLVRQGRVADAFRRFSKALKMLVAIEPINPEQIEEDRVKEMIDLKIKLLNNLSHCQLHYEEFQAAADLCTCSLKYDEQNVKALYRRSTAYFGLHLYEEAWRDIQQVLKLDPHDKAAQQKASIIEPKMRSINKEYKNVIKKMFG
ncbi:tetratricopeptide repeat protein 9C-like [Choristoneura fumiferana]|uniref:tetratricopeptide repeat protein 9C-like n=1 Tax=Choristoneura fumiferana TaxID=7141 RepID=UPI003D158C91